MQTSNFIFNICSERTDPSGSVTKTTRVIKTTKHSGGQHPFSDDVETFNPTDYGTLQSTSKYSSYQDSLKRDEYQNKETKPYTLGILRDSINLYMYTLFINSFSFLYSCITRG